MGIQDIIRSVDAEIAMLQSARALLLGDKRKVGRPAKAVDGKKKRVLSPEARARIAAAQKKRWAAAKKAK